MARSSRDRISVDVHGLKSALIERAQSTGVSPSALVREALTELLRKIDSPETHRSFAKPVLSGGRVRLTLRMSHVQVSMALEGARRSRLSLGDYVAGLVADVPSLTVGGDRSELVAALTASSAELSTLSRNIRHLTSALRDDAFCVAQEYRELLDALSVDLHGHLRLASHLLADLRPRGALASLPKSFHPALHGGAHDSVSKR